MRMSPLPTSPSGPAEAIRRVADAGDAEAWSWLVEHEGPGMFQVAQRVLGSAAAADDACQEAFLHLRRGAARFQAPEPGDADAAARAWLRRIAANAAAMQARAERRRLRRERAEASAAGSAPADADLDALRAALAELPDDQRQPIVLHHLGGQDYIAIGAALGISPGAARVRAHRGMESLRRRLAAAGVLALATGLLTRAGAAEAALPAGSGARWAAALASSSTPAAAPAAIFGGITTMAKLAILGAGIAVAAITTLSLAPVQAEERRSDTPIPKTEAPAAEATKEAKDTLAEGTKGISEGVIVSIEKGKLILRTEAGNLLFMPHWHGGAPKDGGGLDKAVLEKLAAFKAGDKVRIAWTWQERRRIETIEKR